MANRRALFISAGGIAEVPDTDSLLMGLVLNQSKVIDQTNGLTARTLSARRTILSGTVGASLALTLPAASAANDGLLLSVMSTLNRGSVTWLSTGATFTGAPTSLAANVMLTFQYHHALTRWFISA